MKEFNQVEFIQPQEPVRMDRYGLQKQRLLFNLTRSQRVIDGVWNWLSSFEGGISKDVFMKQVSRLSFNDDEAVEQLERAKGTRCIPKRRKPVQEYPPVGDVVQLLASGVLFIAVNGQDRYIRSFIRSTYQTLKALGRTFVLDIDELRLIWTNKYSSGRSQEIKDLAMSSEFLIMVGWEAPLDLPVYLLDWVNSLRRYRVERKLPMISTFARFREKEMFFKDFKKYSVKQLTKS